MSSNTQTTEYTSTKPTKCTSLTIKIDDVISDKFSLITDKKNSRYYINYANKIKPFIQFGKLELNTYGWNNKYGNDEKGQSKLTIPIGENDEITRNFGKKIDDFMTSKNVLKDLGVKANKYISIIRTPENQDQPQKINTKIKGIFDEKGKLVSVITKFFEKNDGTIKQVFPTTLNEIQNLIPYKSTIIPIMSLSVWKYLGKYGVSLYLESIRVTKSDQNTNNNNWEKYTSQYNDPFISDSDEEQEKINNEQIANNLNNSSIESNSDSSSDDDEVETKKTQEKKKNKNV